MSSFPQAIAPGRPLTRGLYNAALAGSLLLWLLPLFAVALTALRPADDVARGNYWGWPSHLAFENFAAIFASTHMARFIFNSVVIAGCSVVCAVTLACMAGFALARYRFRGHLLLFIGFILGNFVPAQILMIPVRNLTIDVLHIYDTYWALIGFHTAFQTGFCTLFMRNFIRQLPNELFDASRVDGLSELQIFRHIALPLMRPAIAAIAVLTFTFVWNDYFWSLVLVQSDEVRPLTSGLQNLRGMWAASWHLISAGSLIAAMPPVALFVLAQRHFIAGLTSGSTNG